jgi:hypothetical protein
MIAARPSEACRRRSAPHLTTLASLNIICQYGNYRQHEEA